MKQQIFLLVLCVTGLFLFLDVEQARGEEQCLIGSRMFGLEFVEYETNTCIVIDAEGTELKMYGG